MSNDYPKFGKKKPIPASYSMMQPGDIVIFKYTAEGIKDIYHRFCLVVRNQLGKIGYVSLRGNPLLSCYRLNDAPTEVVNFIIKRLYKREDLCSYDKIQKGLKSLVGDINYRTYKLSGLNDLNLMNIDRRKNITEDDFEERI